MIDYSLASIHRAILGCSSPVACALRKPALKLLPVIMLVITAALAGCGQKQAASVQAAPKRLSDAYATSALLALKAIQGDVYVPPDAKSKLVFRPTQEKIDASDVTAVTPEERGLSALLGTVYDHRLTINFGEASFKRETAAFVEASPHISKQKSDQAIDELARQSQEDKDRKDKFEACVNDLDASLRARSVDVPASCQFK